VAGYWLEHKGHIYGGGGNYFNAGVFFLALGVADCSTPSNTEVKSAWSLTQVGGNLESETVKCGHESSGTRT
jgi:hypothetical protein